MYNEQQRFMFWASYRILACLGQKSKQVMQFFLTFFCPCISVYLSQYLTNLMHKLCFTISFISCPYVFRAHVLIIRRSKLHYTASGIITPIGVMIPEINSTNVCAVTHEAKSTKMWRTLLLRSTKRVLFLIRQYVWYYAEIHTTDCVAIYLLN